MRKFLAIAITAVSFVSVAPAAFAQVITVYEPNPTVTGNLNSITSSGAISSSAAGDGTIAEVHIGSIIDGTVTGNVDTNVTTTNITNSADGTGTEASVTFGSVGETP